MFHYVPDMPFEVTDEMGISESTIMARMVMCGLVVHST
jgi:hypothetical protein